MDNNNECICGKAYAGHAPFPRCPVHTPIALPPLSPKQMTPTHTLGTPNLGKLMLPDESPLHDFNKGYKAGVEAAMKLMGIK